jgi:hypothetical protein
VKDATAMADDTWRKMTKQEQDELVKIKMNFSSGLSDVDHLFATFQVQGKGETSKRRRKKEEG